MKKQILLCGLLTMATLSTSAIAGNGPQCNGGPCTADLHSLTSLGGYTIDGTGKGVVNVTLPKGADGKSANFNCILALPFTYKVGSPTLKYTVENLHSGVVARGSLKSAQGGGQQTINATLTSGDVLSLSQLPSAYSSLSGQAALPDKYFISLSCRLIK